MYFLSTYLASELPRLVLKGAARRALKGVLFHVCLYESGDVVVEGSRGQHPAETEGLVRQRAGKQRGQTARDRGRERANRETEEARGQTERADSEKKRKR